MLPGFSEMSDMKRLQLDIFFKHFYELWTYIHTLDTVRVDLHVASSEKIGLLALAEVLLLLNASKKKKKNL